MARPRKTQKFADMLAPLSVEELKTLKVEVTSEIRIKEREIEKAKNEENARKMRDKIRIGNHILFEQRGSGNGSVKAEVIGIFADKVQVEVDGRKKSIALTRIESVE
ncbi:MAG: hypothetical protein RQ801_04335 [Spirochaetaceae bacterium]|nr:hypothetical protein [Spirochaetaceae bacterium]MDT8297508.1 hypothetical protein [Spirochaetaceae bacterium]